MSLYVLRKTLLAGGMVAMVTAPVAGCEQPLPPASPAPLELAAEQLNVPASTLLQLQTTVSRIQTPGGSGAPVDPSSPEAERLRRVIASLQEAYQQQTPRTP